jgi:hypothetical protein
LLLRKLAFESRVLLDEGLGKRALRLSQVYDESGAAQVKGFRFSLPKQLCGRLVPYHVDVGGLNASKGQFGLKEAQSAGITSHHVPLHRGAELAGGGFALVLSEAREELLAVTGRAADDGESGGEVVGDAVPQGEQAFVGSGLVEDLSAVSLMGHADRAREGRPGVEVAGVEQVELVLDVIGPAIGVEGSPGGSAEDVGPLGDSCSVGVLVDRHRIGREEVAVDDPTATEL